MRWITFRIRFIWGINSLTLQLLLMQNCKYYLLYMYTRLRVTRCIIIHLIYSEIIYLIIHSIRSNISIKFKFNWLICCYDHSFVTNESSSLAFYPCELGYIVRIRGLKAHKIKKQGRENKVCWTVPDLLFLLLVCRSCSLNHFKEGFRDMSLRIIPLLFRNSLIHNLQKNSCEFIFRWCCYSLA